MRQHDDLFRTWERALFWINHQNHLWVNVKSNPNQIQMLLSHRSSDQPFELAEWPGWRKENLAYTLMIAFFFSGIFAFFSNSCLFSPIPPQKFPTFPILCCSERVLFSAHTHALSDHINVPTNRPIPPVIAPEFFLYFAGFFPREKSGKIRYFSRVVPDFSWGTLHDLFCAPLHRENLSSPKRRWSDPCELTWFFPRIGEIWRYHRTLGQ